MSELREKVDEAIDEIVSAAATLYLDRTTSAEYDKATNEIEAARNKICALLPEEPEEGYGAPWDSCPDCGGLGGVHGCRSCNPKAIPEEREPCNHEWEYVGEPVNSEGLGGVCRKCGARSNHFEERDALLPEKREPVGWRAFYIDARGREVWCGRAFVSETDGLEWCDRFKDLRPTLVPLYARPPRRDR